MMGTCGLQVCCLDIDDHHLSTNILKPTSSSASTKSGGFCWMITDR